AEKAILTRTILEGNMANEIGFVVLSVLEAFCIHFKTQLEQDNGDNVLMRKVSSLLVLFLQIGQSEFLLEHVFAAIRSFINKFPVVLFRGTSSFCATLCYEILQCCKSKLSTVRQQASLILYLLMRSNFEYTGRDFVRVNLQATLAISRIISGVSGNTDEGLIKSSLNQISSLVNSDEGMKQTLFPSQVYNLLKRLRTVLVAMNKMQKYRDDPELLIKLQYSLAQSYVNNPQLRQYWLEQMCLTHESHGNISEAALCQVHIAALIAEYMQRKMNYDHSCRVFTRVSNNIVEEENLQEDKAAEDVIGYTEDLYVEMMEKCVKLLTIAERYELVAEIYRLLLPIYERQRHFQQLADAHGQLHEAYKKIVEVMSSGNRFLGTYYRVSFFGQEFEDDGGKEYIYKEPKVTGLSEISQRLSAMYGKRFNKEVAIIQDSGQVDTKTLDEKKIYIQVTFVSPYFEEEELENRITEFERSTNLHRFMYETPFTLSGKTHGALSEQYKRKTVLTTSHFFPYIKKRLLVVQREQFELTPVEVAIDEMQNKISQLYEVIRDPPDMKKLQLVLQGCVSVQVNAGPMAYAKTFLSPKTVHNYARHHVEKLKSVYRLFMNLCGDALELNGKIIKEDQRKYQEQMIHNYDEMIKDLTVVLGAEVCLIFSHDYYILQN
ncbi:uncharacterized protein TRIADDRAFT_18599, partial [Trichoplax adhaerens]